MGSAGGCNPSSEWQRAPGGSSSSPASDHGRVAVASRRGHMGWEMRPQTGLSLHWVAGLALKGSDPTGREDIVLVDI